MKKEIMNKDFFIGSEWLYYKIYIGSNTANIFLKELNEVTRYLLDNKIIENFFFIRYADPEFHLRIRFKVTKVENLAIVIQKVYELIETFFFSYSIHKVQTDTYKREVERYGGNTMEDSEELFCIDSKIILENLSTEYISEEDVWFKALKMIDVYLNVFDFSLEQKELFTKKLSVGFSHEFPMSKVGKKQLALKYRTNRFMVENVLSSDLLDETFKKHIKELKYIANKIIHKVSSDKESIENLLGSYLHMHCNRFFSNKQRMNEWLLYDFLSIHYRSELQRKRHI